MMTTSEMTSQNQKAKGLYIHIPFCVQRCSYCDFLTFVGAGKSEIEDYVNAVVRHLAAARSNIDLVAQSSSKSVALDSVYLGGGSPSFIDGIYINKIMNAVKAHFKVLENAEISLEANPESVSENKLIQYKEAGINRLSIGVQSMDNSLLEMLGRAHNREIFLEKYKIARRVGFDNISLDLIFALPGQDLKIWQESLEEIIDLDPEHISFYALQIEEGTRMKQLIEQGKLQAIDEDKDRAMYHTALEIFEENGYEHYEISNCAKKGFQSRHNLKYWSMDEYIGIGLGAHSYLGGSRYENLKDLKAYAAAGIGGISVAGEDFLGSKHKNTREDELGEYMFTGLRKVEGIFIKDFENRFGQRPEVLFKKAIEKNLAEGLLQIDKNRIKLSKKGMDLFNRVLVDFV